jgi:hypothetical protein
MKNATANWPWLANGGDGFGKRAAADGLLNYVSERREMILYPEFTKNGWQIGSGPTEACCKTLTQRLKGFGMRWDADNSEAIMPWNRCAKAASGKPIGKSNFPKHLKLPERFATPYPRFHLIALTVHESSRCGTSGQYTLACAVCRRE